MMRRKHVYVLLLKALLLFIMSIMTGYVFFSFLFFGIFFICLIGSLDRLGWLVLLAYR